MGFIATLIMVAYIIVVCAHDKAETKKINECFDKIGRREDELYYLITFPEKEKQINAMLSSGISNKNIDNALQKRLKAIFSNIPELLGYENVWWINIDFVRLLICVDYGFVPVSDFIMLNIRRYAVCYYPSIEFVECNIHEYERHVVKWIEKTLNNYGFDIVINKEGLWYKIRQSST